MADKGEPEDAPPRMESITESPFSRAGEVHLRATWLFTRADMVANLGVILAGAWVFWLGTPYPDYVIGVLIGLYVIKEAVEILGQARRARATGEV